jgi:hypothetical protein
LFSTPDTARENIVAAVDGAERDYVGHIPFWNIDVYEISNLRGIAVGPNDFQRRLQFVIASVVDPAGGIALRRKGRGAGW